MPRVREPPPLHMPGSTRIQARRCDVPGCAEAGEFRAPRGRMQLTTYYWFCLDHVREYNASWNFYAGMSEDEVEAQIRADTTWQRPSWPFGAWRGAHHAARHRVNDPYGLFGEHIGRAGPTDGADGWPHHRHQARTEHEKALAVMQLSGTVTVAAIKTRYKELVKRHHPDANGGDRAAEERLKVINQAYSTLMSRGHG